MGLELGISDEQGAQVIRVVGEVDLNSSPELRTAILEAAKRGGTLAVELREVPYMDSSGVATLVEGLKAMEPKGGAFVLLAPSSAVAKVLQLSRLDSVFDIRETL